MNRFHNKDESKFIDVTVFGEIFDLICTKFKFNQMKKIVFILTMSVFTLCLTSCNSNKMNNEPETTSNEVWAEGISTITGKISSVTPEKDGQTIELINNKGVKYIAVVSISNLRENAAQYRKFEVGESVGFKGNLLDNQRMVVREVLETK